jgi:hypothetical protein
MNNRELDYSDYQHAIVDKRMEMRCDILLCLNTCKLQVVELPLLFSFMNNGMQSLYCGMNA